MKGAAVAVAVGGGTPTMVQDGGIVSGMAVASWRAGKRLTLGAPGGAER
jgi:hypothetical protein